MMTNTLAPDQDDQQYLQNRTVPRQRFNHNEAVNDATGQWLILPAGVGAKNRYSATPGQVESDSGQGTPNGLLINPPWTGGVGTSCP